jgi:hypothetical protein
MFLCVLFAQISLAESLFAHNAYHEARIEYLREFFFYPESYTIETKRLHFTITAIYCDTLEGMHELSKMTNDLPDMSMESKTRIAEQWLALGYPDRARNILEGMDSIRLYGFTHLQEGDLITAHDHFLSVNDTLIAQDISRYLNMPKKSMNTAALLSLVCPGAGEVYAGNTGLGIKDFLLNAGSAFLLYNAIRQKKYIDAVLIFSLLSHRFYIGSLYNAQKTVFEANERKYHEWQEYMRNRYFQSLVDR